MRLSHIPVVLSLLAVSGTATLALSSGASKLRDLEYYDVKRTDASGNRETYEACRDGRRFHIVLDRDGNAISRDARGWCEGAATYDRDRRRRWIEREIDGTRRLKGEQCQDVLEAVAGDTQIFFDKSSADLAPDVVPQIERIARVLKRCPGANIEVAGHADTDGSRDLNQVLSERRAQIVVEQLVRNDVKLQRLKAVGYGETRPLERGGKSANRRIEFVLVWS